MFEKKSLLGSASPKDVDVKLHRECLGNSYEDWGKVVLCLVVLYVGVGLLYGGLLTTAVEVRQEAWLELPSIFFGDFDKLERIPVDANTGAVVPAKTYPLDILADRGIVPIRKFNRPKGCAPVQTGGRTVLLCDKTHDKADNLWTLYPWVAEKGNLAGMGGCSGATDASVNHASILNADGSYAGGDACVNGVMTGSIPV